jgi:N-hydroxyarylamine O-acetyltransferase
MLHYPAATPSDPVEANADAPAPAFLPRYLARIGYAGPIAPTLEMLAALQAAHIAAIPFDAIDALTGAGSISAPTRSMPS